MTYCLLTDSGNKSSNKNVNVGDKIPNSNYYPLHSAKSGALLAAPGISPDTACPDALWD